MNQSSSIVINVLTKPTLNQQWKNTWTKNTVQILTSVINVNMLQNLRVFYTGTNWHITVEKFMHVTFVVKHFLTLMLKETTVNPITMI